MSTKIIEFHVRDTNGKVVRYGTCSQDTFQGQAKQGETVHAGIPEVNLDRPVWDDTYITRRLKAYPPMSEQLDTIFHKGLDVWKSQIQAVKDKHPKV